MPTQVAKNEFLMRCSCGDRVEHVAWLIHEDDRGNNLKGEHDDWYLMAALEPRFAFWQRLSVAFRYLFRMRVGYWGYVEIVLRNQDVDDLAGFITSRRNQP
jgi:hypothetical protein